MLLNAFTFICIFALTVKPKPIENENKIPNRADQFTEVQIAVIRKAFTVFDNSMKGNGTLPIKEMKSTEGYCSSGRQLFVESDADENRAIDFPEFLKLVPKIMIEMENNWPEKTGGTSDDYSEEHFLSFDEDGDGLISGTELRDSAPSINRPFSSEHFHEKIQKIDIDGDGLASHVELLIRASVNFLEEIIIPILRNCVLV